MKGILPYLFFIFSMTCVVAQDSGIKITAVETNLLSLAGGHVGPEVRVHFGRSHQKSTVFLGYRYAFTTVFPFEKREPIELSQYAQSLSGGHDFTVGIRVRSQDFGFNLNFLLQAGTFKYNNEQLICTDASATIIETVSYCRCNEVSLNKFSEKAFRFGGALEANFILFSRPKLQVGFSIMLGLNMVTNTFYNYKLHATCQATQNIEPQTPEWISDSYSWLHGIPKTKHLLSDEVSRFTIGGRTGLWVTYVLN